MGDRLMYPGYTVGAIDRPTVGFEKSMTRQSDADAADINNIMKRFEKTGVLPLGTREAIFEDVSSIGSYQDALERIRIAEEGFMALGPAIREKFLNDPVAFLDFASKAENRKELEGLGVLAAPPAEPGVAAASEPAKPA